MREMERSRWKWDSTWKRLQEGRKRNGGMRAEESK